MVVRQYELTADSIIGVNNEMKVKEGDVIARFQKNLQKTKILQADYQGLQNF